MDLSLSRPLLGTASFIDMGTLFSFVVVWMNGSSGFFDEYPYHFGIPPEEGSAIKCSIWYSGKFLPCVYRISGCDYIFMLAST